MNMASRRIQRELKDKDLHQKNKELKKMISIVRKQSSSIMEGKASRSRERKREHKSIVLPPIE